MKKYALVFLMLISSGWLFAQDIEPLIEAERAFEKASLEKGIREGFLICADSAAIVFGQNGPENAKHFWEAISPFDGIFSWSPAFGEMSISGDWGYTTGNYEHRPKSLTDKPDRFGQYTTVWNKDANGNWKYLIDIGNTHLSAPLDKMGRRLAVQKTGDLNLADNSFLMDLEKKFVLAFENKPQEAYLQYGSSVYILNLSGFGPIRNLDSALIMLRKIPSSIAYHPKGSKISPGKDMAAIYGTLNYVNGGGNYLRIWRHEKSGWKIALEVIGN